MIKLRHLLSEIYIDGFTMSDQKGGFRCPENFDSYDDGKGWSAYRGGNDWENGTTACAIYLSNGEELARIWFTVKFPKGVNPDSDCPSKIAKEAKEWGEKASKKWITAARKIHSVPKEYFKDGSPWYKDWKQCFIEALKSRDFKKYVKDWGIDHTTWRAMKSTKEDEKKPVKSPEPESLNEGSSIPGALEGWLDPNGTCHHVADTHGDWAARYLKQPVPDTKDVGAYEEQRMRLMRELYDKGWARIVIQHGNDLLYFDTYNTHWKTLSRQQRRWLYKAAVYGVKVFGDKITTGDEDTVRHPPYKIEFGNKGGEWLQPDDILERKQ